MLGLRTPMKEAIWVAVEVALAKSEATVESMLAFEEAVEVIEALELA